MKFYSGEQQDYDGRKMEGVYKYVWREEHVAIEYFVKKKFRLRPRGRQGKGFGKEDLEKGRVVSLPVVGALVQTKILNPFK